jgi:flagellar biosynthesis regulator FlbT
MGVLHPTLLNKGERISVEGAVGRIGRRIILILLM